MVHNYLWHASRLRPTGFELCGNWAPREDAFCSLISLPPIVSGTGYCFRSISLFLCQQDYKKNGWTDLHEIYREGVEWPWDDLITFFVNFEKSRDATMRNTGAGFVVLSHDILLRLEYLHKNVKQMICAPKCLLKRASNGQWAQTWILTWLRITMTTDVNKIRD